MMRFQENVSDMVDTKGHEAAASVDSLDARLELAYWGPADHVNSLDEIQERRDMD
jgi:hypothetical protein